MGLTPARRLAPLGPEKPGSYWRPDVSFDGQRALFCYKAHDEQSFHLYEIRLDGTDLRQLTRGDYDDIDPIYLPDGHILFTTTRGNTYVRCGPYIYSYILARCDADGGNIYLISQNSEPDFVPSLMGDGRVIYSRWEYTDKSVFRAPEPVDHQPGRHRHDGLLGQPVGVARPSGGAAPDSRQPASDVLGVRASRLVLRLHRDHRPQARIQLPGRLDQGHLGLGLAGGWAAAGRSARKRGLPRQRPLYELQDAVSAVGRRLPGFRPRRRGQVPAVPDGRLRQSRSCLRRHAQHLACDPDPAASRAATAAEPSGLARHRPGSHACGTGNPLQCRCLPGSARSAARECEVPADRPIRRQDLFDLVQDLSSFRTAGVDCVRGVGETHSEHGAGRGGWFRVLPRSRGPSPALSAAGRAAPLSADHAQFHGRHAGRAPRLRRLPRVAQHGPAFIGRPRLSPPAHRADAAALGHPEHQLRAIRPAGTRPLLWKMPSRGRRGPPGSRPDAAPRRQRFQGTVLDAGGLGRLAESDSESRPAGLRHCRGDRGGNDGRDEARPARPGDAPPPDHAVLHEPAGRTRRQRQAL